MAYRVIPHPDFYEAVFRYLGNEPDPDGIMPTRADFQEQVYPDLVELVQSGWDFAPLLPGRGDYRQLWHSDLGGVVYTITVWRDRPSGVLELRNVVIKPGPPADGIYGNDQDTTGDT